MALKLSTFLTDNNAMLFFQEFLEQMDVKNALDFYLTVDAFRVTSEHKIADAEVWTRMRMR